MWSLLSSSIGLHSAPCQPELTGLFCAVVSTSRLIGVHGPKDVHASQFFFAMRGRLSFALVCVTLPFSFLTLSYWVRGEVRADYPTILEELAKSGLAIFVVYLTIRFNRRESDRQLAEKIAALRALIRAQMQEHLSETLVAVSRSELPLYADIPVVRLTSNQHQRENLESKIRHLIESSREILASIRFYDPQVTDQCRDILEPLMRLEKTGRDYISSPSRIHIERMQSVALDVSKVCED